MKHILLTATLIVLGLAPLVSRAALLVYEPFNYPVGPLTGQSGGMGFSGGWLANAGDNSDGGFVYDQTATNVISGTETPLNWDGKVNDLPTLPTVGARYQGGKTNQSNVNIYRTLANSAGAMAAANGGVLWMSAAYHLPVRTLGSGIVIGLANGHCYDRGRYYNPSTTSFIGANGNSGQSVNTWNYRLNALATTGGWQAGQFAFTVGTNNLPATTNDFIVVMKFTFGASDIVEASVFTENQTLSEAAFYASTNYVSATNSIDESQLTTLTICQGRIANAQDEIRIGTSFADVISLPAAGPVDIAVSTVTASPTNLFADGTSTSAIKVTLTDSVGIPVAGKSVTLASSPGNATISPAGAQTTDANGSVTFTAKSTLGGTEVFTATDTSDGLVISQTASVLFTALAGDAGTSTVVASPTNILANGISTAMVTVTVKNAGGLPLAGKSVTLGSSPGNGTISPAVAQTTDANGQVIFTVKSTAVGTEVFSATDTTDSVVITQTASVEFSPTVADASTSTVAVSPPGVYADGSSTSTITVTLRNATGLPLAGKSVTLAASPSIATLSPLGSQTTDANGVAIYTAKSGTPGKVVFTATNTTDAVLITQTPTVNFVDPRAPIAINFNFYNVSGTPTPEDPSLLVGPNGGLGEMWNQTNSNSATNLVSSLGLPTSVGFTCDSYSRWDWGTPALAMLHGGAAQFDVPGTTTITINGLTPGGYYDVWLATANVLHGSAGTWSTTNLTSSPTNQAVSNVGAINGDTWQNGNNYVRFEYVVADGSGRITFSGASTSTERLPVNGFQLVQTAPPRLSIARSAGNPGQVNFTWNSKTNKVYDLVSTDDLSVPLGLWPGWNGQTNLAATPPNNTLANIPDGGNHQRFFALIERDAPPPAPLLSADFENDNGGFFAVGTPNDWAWGAPNSDDSFGFVLTTANGGSLKCWGTGLGDGSVPSGLINTAADSILQSPPIDFTRVRGAKLTFAAAVDAASGDTIQVQIREAGTDALLGTLTPITVPKTASWASFGPLDLAVAVGKTAYLQFRFVGTNGTYCGLYIDDVVVTGN